MPQFKVLQYNQMIMAYMGIHSHRLSEPTNEFFYAFGTYYVLFCAIVLDILSTGMYILTNLSQFHKILQTFVVFIGGFQHAGMLLSIGLHMKKVKLLQLDLQEIVDQGKCSGRVDCDLLEKHCRLWMNRCGNHIPSEYLENQSSTNRDE